MIGIIIKIVVFGLIFWFVASGVRRLIRDFSQPFRNLGAGFRPPQGGFSPNPPNQRPEASQPRGTVIDLKRDDDGVYRPPGEGR